MKSSALPWLSVSIWQTQNLFLYSVPGTVCLRFIIPTNVSQPLSNCALILLLDFEWLQEYIPSDSWLTYSTDKTGSSASGGHLNGKLSNAYSVQGTQVSKQWIQLYPFLYTEHSWFAGSSESSSCPLLPRKNILKQKRQVSVCLIWYEPPEWKCIY